MEARKRVLLIDDDEECIEYVGSMLAGAGFEVSSATDGQEGLRRAATEQPDLILLDVMMPELDGWDTCDGIRSNEQIKDIPVVFLTCVHPPTTLYQSHGAMETVWEEYLTKPVQKKQLLSTVARLV